MLVSGHSRGTNLQALIDACGQGGINASVAVVVGTRSEAQAICRARAAGIPAAVVSPRSRSEQEYGNALGKVLRKYGIDLICLAGYMRKLPPDLVREYHSRILNVHPALLPLFGGKGMFGTHVHEAVLESGVKITGCTVHFVDTEYDTGAMVV
ncbi:MAG TPA: phosphoribosylglycinamide formyltransferase, partial [Chthonomonadales bacterium]|nr:phosphoribosylglycinamide formyltransferase [Chthonomonadales bacterium]